jgi:hypothetical protein
MTPVAGAYPLTGVAKLPNATVAFPGEVWSNSRANGIIIPGAAVAPVNVGGKLRHKQLIAGDTPDKEQVGVALRQVEVPDVNSGPGALGPNEIVNPPSQTGTTSAATTRAPAPHAGRAARRLRARPEDRLGRRRRASGGQGGRAPAPGATRPSSPVPTSSRCSSPTGRTAAPTRAS